MKLVLNSNNFERINEKSSYNHNYYKYIGNVCNKEFEIYEICHEDDNFCEFFIVKEGVQTFLGCSTDYIHPCAMVNIDFQVYYT